MSQFGKYFIKPVPASPLAVFRIVFGLLITLEAWGAIATGWVYNNLIAPNFNFGFIGFEWLKPLPGYGMYVYYGLMGLCGVGVLLGFKYRWSVLAYGLLWTGTYLMQKTSYNNHYYLLILLLFIMALVPANTVLSLDAKQQKNTRSNAIPYWSYGVLILLLLIVYSYASIAKLNPDWFQAIPLKTWLKHKQDYVLIGGLFKWKYMPYLMAYGGILFDGLVIPMLLWKPTRKWAFFIGVFFHLFNSATFQIGIFPYLMIGSCILFFNYEKTQNWLKNKGVLKLNATSKNDTIKAYGFGWKLPVFIVFFALMLILPLRHHVMPGNVNFTEEGHRMAWRMMLRNKSGYGNFTVVDKKTNKTILIKDDDYLTKKQIRKLYCYPDFAWQYAQYLEQQYAIKGIEVAVYCKANCSLNYRKHLPLIDETVDLANVKWKHFKTNEWVLKDYEFY